MQVLLDSNMHLFFLSEFHADVDLLFEESFGFDVHMGTELSDFEHWVM